MSAINGVTSYERFLGFGMKFYSTIYVHSRLLAKCYLLSMALSTAGLVNVHVIFVFGHWKHLMYLNTKLTCTLTWPVVENAMLLRHLGNLITFVRW